ncbi:MAG: hypothetical protein K2L34_02540 [Muribaculaceae bacterium]|nr:hypothetical protein [Muribaculaceae bacterium]
MSVIGSSGFSHSFSSSSHGRGTSSLGFGRFLQKGRPSFASPYISALGSHCLAGIGLRLSTHRHLTAILGDAYNGYDAIKNGVEMLKSVLGITASSPQTKRDQRFSWYTPLILIKDICR